jgi:hypothetical protein
MGKRKFKLKVKYEYKRGKNKGMSIKFPCITARDQNDQFWSGRGSKLFVRRLYSNFL